VTNEHINAALVELQSQLPRISKDLTAKVQTKTGGNYTYTYADLALISREVLPLLAKCGLAFTSRPTMRDGRFVLVYELRHSSGEQIEGEYPLLDRGTPQEVGGAITYARRYCLCAVTGVAPDDDDNDAIAAEKAAKRQRRDPQQLKAQAPALPPMNADQQKRLQKAFEGLGMEAKEARLAFARKVVKRQLKSATELTRDEAEAVIAHAEDKDGEAWLAEQPPPDGAGVPA
jgi:hypothetical protein